MKLIGSFTSAYVRKARVVLAEKKLDYQFELENVWSAETKIASSNPLGKVPCLVMEDGSTMYDSRVIAEYLDTLTPVCKLLPPNSRDRANVKVWEALADGVLDAAVLAYLERTWRPAGQQSQAWFDRQMGKVHGGLAVMAENLGEQPFCMGIHYTLADVAVGCTLGWLAFRFPDIAWRDTHPNLARLFDKLSERQSFKDTVPH
ncbi:glutathione S-transferase N-terminal domain-containing protein [Massilia pinisoli]|jgi:glutathione S-transferase|uniref:Glutathione S-transferase N-terminal domain-containing protein n=1 Tax=Massilia pinisoli TaxID=1772194 RepID=A0ABT1ZTX1_9BURK|nr:glutathione S-transferase N-terminal domain-containing protein [Massilia pinisoli]MCS0583291.1 glutathione S-transferase N-terminal domain-containing protein [Massilia pinisoli]